MNYLFAAYCAIWCIIFVYLWSLKSRQRALENRVEALSKQVASRT